ncbi:spirocyclase AveC family protein [Nonomuraea sp. NPDC050022]|uniref:spirocyclase AveC family protein n=1 Tax=unclassified Nonomuraea TaxID=2593643 RepID=UPI0033F85A91
MEILWIRSGAFAYPYAIREVSLFAGHWYQSPLRDRRRRQADQLAGGRRPDMISQRVGARRGGGC